MPQKHPVGRPPGTIKDPHLKRIKLTSFRLPAWLIDWIQNQPGSGGRVIERALMEFYKLKEKK